MPVSAYGWVQISGILVLRLKRGLALVKAYGDSNRIGKRT